MRFIHTSDWQLGMTRHFLGPEAQARFTQDRIDAIVHLGRLAEAHAAAFMVVAGDVFESNQLARQTVVRAVDALATVPVPVFLLPGNHDPLDAASVYDSAPFRSSPAHVRVLRDGRPSPVPGLTGWEVVGAPWTSKRPLTDLCAAMLADLTPGPVRIAVAHGQVDSLAPDGGRPDTIVLARAEAALADGRIHYLALGDRHSITAIGGSGAIWYCGAPVATDFDEVEPNQALLVELEPGAPPRVQPLAVGRWRFLAQHEQIHDLADVARVRAWLADLPEKARTVVKIGLEGTVSLATAAALDALLAEYQDHFASLRRRERTSDLVLRPDALDEDSVSLMGYAKGAWDELAAAARGSNAQATEARDALALFYRLAQEGSR
jgi:DNA repair exonuclease SbcCD nuclease subunit